MTTHIVEIKNIELAGKEVISELPQLNSKSSSFGFMFHCQSLSQKKVLYQLHYGSFRTDMSNVFLFIYPSIFPIHLQSKSKILGRRLSEDKFKNKGEEDDKKRN